MLTQLRSKWNNKLCSGLIQATLIFLLSMLVMHSAAAKPGKFELQWLGHAAFKLTSVKGKVILIDPFITNNPKTPAEYKDLKSLGKIDLILITHAHGDHVGDAIELSKMHNAPVYAPPGLNDTFTALGILTGKLSPRFNKGSAITPLGPDIKITMTHAEHSSEYRWKNPQTGATEIHVGGEPAGYIIELENGIKVYHMGDTGIFSDMNLIRQYYKPDLVLIPIGSNFTMDPEHAAYATKNLLKPRFAIPIHYGTFPILKGTAEEYIKILGKTKTQVIVMKPGESRRW